LIPTVKMPAMQAETLNCPNCGAASSSDAPQCQFCGSRLATIACAACFGMMFIGSKHCPRCGAAAAPRESLEQTARNCPRCGLELLSIRLGSTPVQECDRCQGLWLDVASFENICTNREQQAAVLGGASPAPANLVRETTAVKYVPCPQCSQLMNRINFARCSGVIVDVCKGHGTWFDRDELSRIVEFIRAGGLEASRNKEKAELQAERRRLHDELFEASDIRRSTRSTFGDSEDRITGIASTRDLLKFLLD
jgi:Zn-finger nucleic acid-binding protein